MRFSIWPSPMRPWDEILELTQHCERTGWDGVYFADHFMPNAPDATPLDGDTLECWSVIAGLASYVSAKWLTRYFETRTLTPFAIYSLIAGVICIVRFA